MPFEEVNRYDNNVNTMHGWFHKLFKRRASSSTHEEEAKGTTIKSLPSSNSFTPSPPRKTLTESHAMLNSPQRWTRKYDVLVCHSHVDSDIEEAIRLVSFLENSPRSLRCFLWHRDTCPGGAVSTELCQAVQDSHIRVLLITPHFLEDEWCKYTMHQILVAAPMSNQMIPLLQGLLSSEYPQEIKFLFYIDLSCNRDRGYDLVNKTVLRCDSTNDPIYLDEELCSSKWAGSVSDWNKYMIWKTYSSKQRDETLTATVTAPTDDVGNATNKKAVGLPKYKTLREVEVTENRTGRLNRNYENKY